jgi:hypothetical protein
VKSTSRAGLNERKMARNFALSSYQTELWISKHM